MSNAFGGDDPGLFQGDGVRAEVIEQPHPRSEQDGYEADLDLVELPGAEQLPGRLIAAPPDPVIMKDRRGSSTADPS
jgi:hypothetical protein